jgi:hypothetical protein
MSETVGPDNGGVVRAQIHSITPRETAGRDAIERFECQFRAAAIAALRILKAGALDRVYCDSHDDYVTRELVDGVATYHFFQVKTKGVKKHHWSRLELFGIAKKIPKDKKGVHAPGLSDWAPASKDELDRICRSFVGKLIEHAVRFGDSCGLLTFQTNAHLDDDVEEIQTAVLAGNVGERTVRYLAENHDVIYSIVPATDVGTARRRVLKIRFSTGHAHLDPNGQDFVSKAIEALWEFSEINFFHIEGVALVEKLLSLIRQKSRKKLPSQLTASDLDDIAGVGIDDLLDLLPISRGAYRHFLNGGDAHALKSSSVLQRKLSAAGADAELIELASQWKLEWDNWVRQLRHTHGMEVGILQKQINDAYGRWVKGDVTFYGLQAEVEAIKAASSSYPFAATITTNLLVGGVMSELVRSEAR